MSNYPRHSNPIVGNDNDFIVSVTPKSMTFSSMPTFSRDSCSDDDVRVTSKPAQMNLGYIKSDDQLISVQPARKIWGHNSEAKSIFEEYSERRKNENDQPSTIPDDVIAVVVRNKTHQDISPTTQSAALGLQFQIDPFTEPSALEIRDAHVLNSSATELEQVPASKMSSSLENASSFFDEMEKTIDGVSETNQMSHQAAVDDFELKLKNMLSGRVPEEYAKKVENETNTTTLSVQNAPEQVKSKPPDQDAGNPHAFFDQIAQVRSQARVMDLGTFKANLDFLDSVDQARELQRREEESMNAEKIKSMSYASQNTGAKPVQIPDAMTMTSMDWIEDLAQVTVEPQAKALTFSASEQTAPTSTPVHADTIPSNAPEQALQTDPKSAMTICVCADLPKAQ